MSIAQHFLADKPKEKLYDAIFFQLFVAQSLAIMEILHAIFGVVRSGVMSTVVGSSSPG